MYGLRKDLYKRGRRVKRKEMNLTEGKKDKEGLKITRAEAQRKAMK